MLAVTMGLLILAGIGVAVTAALAPPQAVPVRVRRERRK